MKTILNDLSIETKETLKTLCADYDSARKMEDEAKQAKEKAGNAIKEILERIEFNGNETFADYKIRYKETVRLIADTKKMKDSGIFDAFSKESKSKPLYID